MGDREDNSVSPVPSQEECDAAYSKARTSLDGRAAPFVPGVGRLSQDFSSISIDLGGETGWSISSTVCTTFKQGPHSNSKCLCLCCDFVCRLKVWIYFVGIVRFHDVGHLAVVTAVKFDASRPNYQLCHINLFFFVSHRKDS